MTDATYDESREFRLRSNSLDWLDVDGEVVILDASKSVYMSINHSGAEIWRMLQHGATVGQLATRLVDSYGIEKTRATEDVRQFLQMLESHDLVEAG